MRPHELSYPHHRTGYDKLSCRIHRAELACNSLTRVRSLTIDQARRVAIKAQRLDRRRSSAPLALLRYLGAVQIDSVNVLA